MRSWQVLVQWKGSSARGLAFFAAALVASIVQPPLMIRTEYVLLPCYRTVSHTVRAKASIGVRGWHQDLFFHNLVAAEEQVESIKVHELSLIRLIEWPIVKTKSP